MNKEETGTTYKVLKGNTRNLIVSFKEGDKVRIKRDLIDKSELYSDIKRSVFRIKELITCKNQNEDFDISNGTALYELEELNITLDDGELELIERDKTFRIIATHMKDLNTVASTVAGCLAIEPDSANIEIEVESKELKEEIKSFLEDFFLYEDTGATYEVILK